MSEITDFYLSWNSASAFGASGVRLRDQEPTIFKPTDISGCALWLNAANNFAVVYNDVLVVTSWSNEGYLGGQFDLSGNSLVLYGDTLVNGFNTVTFQSNAYMVGNFAFNFQAKSLFFVTKENTNLGSNTANPWLSSDTSNGLEVFSLANGVQTYFIGKHPSPIPEIAFETSNLYIGTPTMVEFINGSNTLDNWAGVNGVQYPLIYSVAASNYNTSNIPYYLGGYFGGSPVPADQNICEIIMYDTALSEPQRINVENYLRTKWALQEPPPPPPAPFAPTDISGLAVWLDANNAGTFTFGSSNDISSWSNQGSAGGVFSSNVGTALLVADSNSNTVVSMDSNVMISTYVSLPYYSRSMFIVFESRNDFTGSTYPYMNLFNGDATNAEQTGITYDSNTALYNMTMCQRGTNCPIIAPFSNLQQGKYNLGIWIVDSNSSSSTVAYFNGGSNINTSTDLGNIFNTSPIPIDIGVPVSDSPAFNLGEIIEYDSALNAGQISTVANYLVTKWAISSFVAIS